MQQRTGTETAARSHQRKRMKVQRAIHRLSPVVDPREPVLNTMIQTPQTSPTSSNITASFIENP
jgi:hypothetical protein